MKIETETSAGFATMRLTGELNGDDNRQIVAEVSRLLDAGTNRIIINLGAVPFVNSSGLRDLVDSVARSNSMSGRIVLTDVTSFVEGVFRTTRLDRFFEIMSTEAEARQAFA